MPFNPKQLRLYFIMGSNNTKKDPVYVLKQAIKGGITAFQFREKGKKAKKGVEKLALGHELRKLCRQHQIPFIVNDDAQLAMELDADGVHIGQSDEPITEVRKKVPSHVFIGVSTSNPTEAIKAEQQGADYIGVGPIFKTRTKEDALVPIGIEGLQATKRQINSIPFVAISGVTSKSASELFDSGASGIAVISAISRAVNVYQATRDLSEATLNK